jgi:hypothetical protein
MRTIARAPHRFTGPIVLGLLIAGEHEAGAEEKKVRVPIECHAASGSVAVGPGGELRNASPTAEAVLECPLLTSDAGLEQGGLLVRGISTEVEADVHCRIRSIGPDGATLLSSTFATSSVGLTGAALLELLELFLDGPAAPSFERLEATPQVLQCTLPVARAGSSLVFLYKVSERN